MDVSPASLNLGATLAQSSPRVHGTVVLCQPHIPPGKAGAGAPKDPDPVLQL
jgi:hypothetical protein